MEELSEKVKQMFDIAIELVDRGVYCSINYCMWRQFFIIEVMTDPSGIQDIEQEMFYNADEALKFLELLQELK